MNDFTVGRVVFSPSYSPDYVARKAQKLPSISDFEKEDERKAVQYLKDILFGSSITYERVEEIKMWLKYYDTKHGGKNTK